jgi:uncharacterized protein YecT (DUF1311 family)
MRIPSSVLLALLIAGPSAPSVRAADLCSPSQSTVDEVRCVREALKAVDRKLEQAFARVAADAKSVPGETYQV